MLGDEQKERIRQEIIAKLEERCTYFLRVKNCNRYDILTLTVRETIRECEMIKESKMNQLEVVAAELKQIGTVRPGLTIAEVLEREREGLK